jgi:hypothetical protein
MYKMRFFLLLTLSVSLLELHAQSAGLAGQASPNTITGPAYVLKSEIPIAPPTTVGSSYLDEHWQPAEMLVKTDLLVQDLSARLELEQGMIEFKVNNQVRHLPIGKVEYVNIINAKNERSIFRKASAYEFEGARLQGIVEVISDGPFGVIKQHYIEVLQANYNVAMDVGSRDHRRVKRERLFLLYNGKLIAAKGSSRKLVPLLDSQHQVVASAIIKEHDLRISEEADLRRFASLMNQAQN